MKKNVMMRIASFLLVAVLITTCGISGTYAKYTTTESGSDMARVAKWDIKLEGQQMKDGTFTFDLFNTVLDTDKATETDVKSRDDKTVVAPGTQGSFEINLGNDSEVNAKYSVAFTVVNTNNIPLQYSIDNGTNWTSDITSLKVTDKAINMDAVDTVTVLWKWVYENGTGDTLVANDIADTNLGYDGTATVTVTATVTATQVD